MSQQTVSRAVDILGVERGAGLVDCVQDRKDRRRKRVVLAPKGEELTRALVRAVSGP